MNQEFLNELQMELEEIERKRWEKVKIDKFFCQDAIEKIDKKAEESKKRMPKGIDMRLFEK
jgi:hypothetical protein